MKRYFNKKHKAMVSANRYVCGKKTRYPTSIDAWEGAEYFYITKGTFSAVYKCCACNEYHLTSHASLGDTTQLPESIRELFSTSTQEQGEVPFIIRLREMFV